MIMWNDSALISSDITYYSEHDYKGNRKTSVVVAKCNCIIVWIPLLFLPVQLPHDSVFLISDYVVRQTSVKIDTHNCCRDV